MPPMSTSSSAGARSYCPIPRGNSGEAAGSTTGNRDWAENDFVIRNSISSSDTFSHVCPCTSDTATNSVLMSGVSIRARPQVLHQPPPLCADLLCPSTKESSRMMFSIRKPPISKTHCLEVHLSDQKSNQTLSIWKLLLLQESTAIHLEEGFFPLLGRSNILLLLPCVK